jgi:hypothetical protein
MGDTKGHNLSLSFPAKGIRAFTPVFAGYGTQ